MKSNRMQTTPCSEWNASGVSSTNFCDKCGSNIMNKFSLFSVCVVAALSLVACGKSKDSASGFGSETTNGIAMRGTTVAGAQVIVHQAFVTDSDAETKVDTADSNGHWEIQVEAGGYLVELRNGTQAGTRNVVVIASDTAVPVEISLGDITQVKGRVAASALAKRTVSSAKRTAVLYGLGKNATVANDGSFEIDSVPEGKYVVRIEEGGDLLTEAPVGTGDEVQVVDASQKGFMIENFNDGDNNTELAKMLDGGGWLNWLDTIHEISDFISTNEAYAGKSLHVLPAEKEGALLLVLGSRGIADEWENTFDLSASDSVVYMAKGTGMIVFDVWAAPEDSLGEGWVHLEMEMALHGDWTRHAIAWRDLARDQVAIGNAWSRYRVLKLTWKLRKGTQMWLDDVQIPDLTAIDLLSP